MSELSSDIAAAQFGSCLGVFTVQQGWKTSHPIGQFQCFPNHVWVDSDPAIGSSMNGEGADGDDVGAKNFNVHYRDIKRDVNLSPFLAWSTMKQHLEWGVNTKDNIEKNKRRYRKQRKNCV